MLLETSVLNRASKRTSLLCLRDSLVVNGLSTAAGACLVAAGVLVRGETDVPHFAGMFIGTLLLETPVLMLLLSPCMSVARTLRASAQMNAASYLLIALLVFSGMMR